MHRKGNYMKLILILLLAFKICIYAGTIYLEKENITPCIVNLRNENSHEIGSGILIGYKNREFIATASHVAKILNDSSDLVLGDNNDNPIKLKIIDLSKNVPIKWFVHEKADLAILEIIPKAKTIKLFEKRFFPSEAIFDKLQSFSRDNQLTVDCAPKIEIIL
jgi:hypothetical protein